MSQSPLRAEGSRQYSDAWRAINILIRSDGTWSGRERNLCFRNRGDGTFEDISFTSGLDLAADGRAFVPLDLDGDGDLDLIVKNRNGTQLRAFRNDLQSGRTRHLTVRLEGRRSNRDGVGARVQAVTSRRTLTRQIVSGSGFLSQRSRAARFALADDEVVREVRVRWPGAPAQQIVSPPQQGRLLLVEGEDAFREFPGPAPTRQRSEPAGALKKGRGTWLARPLPAPEFALPAVGGGPDGVRLSAYQGRWVLLNFWATWCPPCRSELVQFQERSADFERSGVEILAVSVDDPGAAGSVAAMAEDLGLDFPVLLADRRTAETYSVLNERVFDRRRALAIPTSFLLDRAGRIVKVYRGEADPRLILADTVAGAGSALPFSGEWAVSQPRRDFEDLASAFAERGLKSPALQMFDEALTEGDPSSRLLNNLAGILISDGDVSRSEGLLRRALAADPGMTDAKVNLASLLAGRGAAAEAETLLEEVLAGQPGDGQALSVLGSIRFSQGRSEAAETLFRRAVEADPEDARFRENLGAAMASRGSLAAALLEYERARDLGASSAALHTNLAVLYVRTGRAEEALHSFLSAVEADPGSPGPHLNLARFRLQENKVDEALDSIRRAKEAAPRDPGPLLMEAQALAMDGRVQEARGAAEQALRLDPSSAEAAQMLESLR